MVDFIRLLTDLGLEESEAKKALNTHSVVQERFERLQFLKFNKDIAPFSRGTLVFTIRDIIPECPRTRVIYNLENGIKKHFGETPFYVEEGIAGYRVRIAKVLNRVVVITKGGHICPFSTERVTDFFDVDKFFKENPDLILCGTIAGPNNPYVREHPSYIKEDIKFYLSDIIKKISGDRLPQEEIKSLSEKYSIPHARVFGKFTLEKLGDIWGIIDLIEDEENYGVLLKDEEGKKVHLLYMTPTGNINEIMSNSNYYLEMPHVHYIQRIIRIGYHLAQRELEEGTIEKIEKRLGEALLLPFAKNLRETIATKKTVEEEFSVKVKNPKTAEKLLNHLLNLKRDIQIRDVKKDNDLWTVTFVELHRAATKNQSGFWRGNSVAI